MIRRVQSTWISAPSASIALKHLSNASRAEVQSFLIFAASKLRRFDSSNCTLSCNRIALALLGSRSSALWMDDSAGSDKPIASWPRARSLTVLEDGVADSRKLIRSLPVPVGSN